MSSKRKSSWPTWPKTVSSADPAPSTSKCGHLEKDAKQKPEVDVVTYLSTYVVKDEFTETAEDIFRKHGDIAAGCLFNGTLRMEMLKSTYAIYEKLKASKFSSITLAELDSMHRAVSDLRKAMLKVDWLEERLDQIYEAKLCVECSPLMNEKRRKSKACVETLEKELSMCQYELSASRLELETEKAKTGTIVQTFLEAKDKMVPFSWKLPKDDSSSTPSKPAMEDYEVKQEFKSAAQDILSNQGDILANCLFDGPLRPHLFNSACAIYLKREKMSLKNVTLAELEAIQIDVRDLEKAQVDVSWVSKGLYDMYETKKSLDSPAFIEKLHEENRKHIQDLEKGIESAEAMVRKTSKKLEAEKAILAKMEQDHLDAKEKVSRFFRKSLVYDILS